MTYASNPASGGPNFKSRLDSGVHVATVEADDVVLKQIIDEASATVTYVCEAPVGTALTAAAWRVRRITVAGTVTTVEWAGTGAFDQVANTRAALSYS